jgi:hypothetical protein
MSGYFAIICTSIGLGSLLHTLSRWLRNYRNPVKVRQIVRIGNKDFLFYD